jgi:hypothetical protein
LGLFVLFLNGVLTKFSRNFAHVTVWNEGFAPPPFAADKDNSAGKDGVTNKDSGSNNNATSTNSKLFEPVNNSTSSNSLSNTNTTTNNSDRIVSSNLSKSSSSAVPGLMAPTVEILSMRKMAMEYHATVNQVATVLEVRIITHEWFYGQIGM